MTTTETGQRYRAGRWINIAVIVIGAVGVGTLLLNNALHGLAAHAAPTTSLQANVAGVQRLEIHASEAELEVRFADVAQATLDVSSHGQPLAYWDLSRDGETLYLDSGDRWGALVFSVGENDGRQVATLTLPEELQRAELDLDAYISSSAMAAEADWGDVDVEVHAGNVDLGGIAQALAVEVSYGEARIDIGTPGAVRLGTSAGRIVGVLRDPQPALIVADASAGNIDLEVPAGPYAVDESESVGESVLFDVVEDPNATSKIQITVSAADVTIRGAGE